MLKHRLERRLRARGRLVARQARHIGRVEHRVGVLHKSR
jgi:hypothetical protein